MEQPRRHPALPNAAPPPESKHQRHTYRPSAESNCARSPVNPEANCRVIVATIASHCVKPDD